MNDEPTDHKLVTGTAIALAVTFFIIIAMWYVAGTLVTVLYLEK